MIRSTIVLGIACLLLAATAATAGHTTTARHVQGTYVHTPLTYGAVLYEDGGYRLGDSSVGAAIESGETEVRIDIVDASGLPVLAYWLVLESGYSGELGTFCGSTTLPLEPDDQAVFVHLPNAGTTAIDAVQGTCGDPVTTATLGTVDLWFT